MIQQEVRQALLADVTNWVRPSMFATNPKFLHVIVEGDSERMLAVAKQMALLAHFPSFRENDANTVTRITILSKQGKDDTWKESFGNLFKVNANSSKSLSSWIDIPLDVQIELVVWEGTADDWRKKQESIEPTVKYEYVIYNEKNIAERLPKNKWQIWFNERKRLRLAKRVNCVYEESQRFDLMRADDIENIHEFDVPVRRFLRKSVWKVNRQWRAQSMQNRESSFAMADSLLVRIVSLKQMNPKQSCSKTLIENMKAMSCSEHSRWNVEKLINGFRPYMMEEVVENECLPKDARRELEMAKKKDPAQYAHIDLCSYDRLCRIDLDSIKYDSFLLRAMVRYWEKISKFENYDTARN